MFVRQQNQLIHELQLNLEQITRDKMSLEAEIMKMSSYKSEVMILQSEIMKLQVSAGNSGNSFHRCTELTDSISICRTITIKL